MKFFVTGVGGQLGHDVMNELLKRGHEGVGSDIQENYSGVADGSAVTKAPYVALDITDKDAVEKVITEVNPDAVVHCAAWTAVDMAEDDDKVAKVRAINAGGTQNIADVCKKLDCKMTYISTDYVFDGQGTEPWQPDCKDYKPLNVYGQTKLEGELAVSQILEKYFTDSCPYLIAYVFVDIMLMTIGMVMLLRRKSILLPFSGNLFSVSRFLNNVTSGIFLMLGNFASTILTGMDRWFIKILMDNTAFAMYSFAVTMENLMNVAVTPVSTTLYNYFCCHKEETELRNIKGKIILFAAAIVTCAFPAKFILETFLTKYLDSASVIFYLFGAQIFYIIVRCFYVNLYKAQKRQKEYFARLIAVIVIGFIFNAGFYAILHTKEAFAIGTMLCGVTWYVLSEFDFKTLRSNWKENLFLLLAALSYLLLGAVTEALTGLVLYAALLVLLSLLLMRKDVMDCWEMVKAFLGR